jgi:hypothetical protein
MVRYYGYYSNVSRGKRKKADQDRLIPFALEPEESSEEYRKNWAGLIRLWMVDPENLPGGSPYLHQMRGEEEDFILHSRPGNNEKNTQTSGLVEFRGQIRTPSERAILKFHIDDSYSQIPA